MAIVIARTRSRRIHDAVRSLRNRTPVPQYHRPPDLVRGAEVVRLELDLPQLIQAQIAQWESGARKDFGPKDAAELLWSLPAALHLNGAPSAVAHLVQPKPGSV